MAKQSTVTNVSALEQQFGDLQNYSDNLYHQVVELQKKIASLEAEKRSLESIVKQNVPHMHLDSVDLSIGITNEQLICETQISILKDAAITRSLTMEEAKKFQIFVDILETLKKSDDAPNLSVEKMDEGSLLQQLELVINGETSK